MKDYEDLFFILKSVSLDELLALCAVKFTTLDRNLILKSLVYFDDIQQEKIRFVRDHEISLDEIKKSLQKAVREV